MKASRNYANFPELRKTNNKKDELFNHIISWMKDNKWGFTSHQVSSLGKYVVTTLTECLWYLDPFWERLKSRGVQVPNSLKPMTGYRDFKSQKKKIPQLAREELMTNSEKISELLLMPWTNADNNKKFRDIIEDLVFQISKYTTFLGEMKERSRQNNDKTEPVRSFNDNWELKTIESLDLGSSLHLDYEAVDRAIKEAPFYKIIDLINFEPVDKDNRKTWINKFTVSSPVNLFTYRYGNYLGNMNTVWKIPSEQKMRDPAAVARNINMIKENVLQFATRRMRKDFMNRYSSKCKIQPVILRDIFNFLTDFEPPTVDQKERVMDERFVQFLLEAEDPEVIFDLRKHNGRPNNPAFERFWEALDKLLQEKSAVHERRQNDLQYLPFAISIEELREQVLEKLPPGSPAPSVSWIRLNFHPKNPYLKSAVHYTGRFNLKYSVQQRLLRVQHMDSDYCRHQFTLLKSFAVKWKDYSLFQSLDDKAIVPVGNPEQPVSTGVRSHHGAIVANENKVVALDHDFHVAGLVPSVYFSVTIPESVHDSFYRGSVHVTVKDKVFEPSSPLRHSAETVKIVRSYYSEDDVNCQFPIVIRYTDGGPDHRTTFKSVQMSCLLEFIALDLDMLVAARTAPAQSYHNPAERVMSTLSLGLQNVALERMKMRAEFEMQAKSLNSLKAIRNAAQRNEGLKKAFSESMEHPLSIVKQRFGKLKWTGERIIVHDGASKEEQSELSRLLQIIDPMVNFEDQKTWNSPELQKFIDNHCRKRHYMFQIKKCTSDQCAYCILCPPRIPVYDFKNLHFVPDPVLENDTFLDFERIYGTDTEELARPSAQKIQEKSDRDKQFKGILVATKVRAFVTCKECGKRRVVYSSAKLSSVELRSITGWRKSLYIFVEIHFSMLEDTMTLSWLRRAYLAARKLRLHTMQGKPWCLMTSVYIVVTIRL